MKKSSRGSSEVGLTFLIDVVILLVALIGAYVVVSGSVTADLVADSRARSMGALVDVAAISKYDTTLVSECPKNTVLTLEGTRVTAEAKSLFGRGHGEYFVLQVADTTYPDLERVNCAQHAFFEVRKREATGRIEVNGQ